MNAHTPEHSDHGFAIGLLTGAFVGVGLVLWLAPRSASELGERMSDSAKSLGERASAGYRQASDRVGEAVDELTRKGRGVLDHAAEAVAFAPGEVDSSGTAARSGRVAETGTQPAADRSVSKPHSL